jgi:hypothetical protein
MKMAFDFNKYSSGSQSQEKSKSNYLIKVGVEKEVYVSVTDKMEKMFIALPQPLYLDGMKKNQVSGEGEFQTLLANGNSLLESLLRKANTLKPGEECVTKLQVRIYRRKDEKPTVTGESFDDDI